LIFLKKQKQTSLNLISKSTAAFTLVELLVAFTVITIVAGMMYTQRSGFTRSVVLNNVAKEVALAVRQTQNYGMSSRGSDIGDDVDDFSYGISLDADSSQGQFFIYRDSHGNKRYQPSDELIETYSLPDEIRIIGICRTTSFNDTSCGSFGGELVIMFSRPHPDAEFRNNNSGNLFSDTDTAIILLEDTDSGSRRSVIVRKSGFIAVE
jgi:Tfp pilus assembly protein FimT